MIRNVRRSPEAPPARAFGYGRVSHESQVDGDSVPAQEKRVKAYWQALLEPKGVEWGGFHADTQNVSAFFNDFEKRRVGRALMERIQPGDHLLVDKVDRLSRRTMPFLSLMEYFGERGVNVHFLDFNGHGAISMGTAINNLLMTMIIAIAQMESETISERICAQKEYTRSQGMWTSGPKTTPIGTKAVRVEGHPNPKARRLVWDMEVRSIMQQIVRLRQTKNLRTGRMMEWNDVSESICRDLAEASGEVFDPKAERYWAPWRCEKAYVRERLYEGVDDPAGMLLTDIARDSGRMPYTKGKKSTHRSYEEARKNVQERRKKRKGRKSREVG